MRALVKDAETIEAIDGFSDDKWVDGIFSHIPWSRISCGFSRISYPVMS